MHVHLPQPLNDEDKEPAEGKRKETTTKQTTTTAQHTNETTLKLPRD